MSSGGAGGGAVGGAPQQVLETKVVILGHTGVGKTSMLNQFVRGTYTGNTTATIGAAFMKKIVSYNGWQIILQIWDTAGQERFRSMTPMYYRGAHAAVLVFDMTSADTLEKVSGWAEELSGHANDDMVLVLAGNKCDLRVSQSNASSPVSSEINGNTPNTLQAAAQQYARSINAAYFETSAKTGKGIEELFQHVAASLLKQHLDKQNEKSRAGQAHSRQTVNSANVTRRDRNGDGAGAGGAGGCC